MRENSKPTPESSKDAFSRKVGDMEIRKLKAKRRGVQGIWFGIGTFGLIGWSVAVPTLLGVLLGIFIDAHFPGTRSWTLSLLIIGLILGCLNAWHWVAKEEKSIREDEKK